MKQSAYPPGLLVGFLESRQRQPTPPRFSSASLSRFRRLPADPLDLSATRGGAGAPLILESPVRTRLSPLGQRGFELAVPPRPAPGATTSELHPGHCSGDQRSRTGAALPLPLSDGTEGSNPSSSSGESGTNRRRRTPGAETGTTCAEALAWMGGSGLRSCSRKITASRIEGPLPTTQTLHLERSVAEELRSRSADPADDGGGRRDEGD